MGIVTTMRIALVYTSNWLSEYSEETRDGEKRISLVGAAVADRALREAKQTIDKGKGPDFYVFNGGNGEERLEDGGRTKILGFPGVVAKTYATLEDYGDPEEWPQMYEPEIVQDLREGLHGSRYKLTVMLASDY